MRLAHAMKRSTPKLSADALAALEVYPFPGNVRELENILERALALADGDAIHAEDLRLPAQQSVTPAAVASAFVSANAAAASNPGTPTTPPDPRTLGPRETASSALPSYIEEIERAAIRSEEHTSELQSLMRISYAVFCLKKKKNTHTH